MPMVTHIPAPRSALATPTRTASPSGSPVTLITPDIAWAIASYPARPLSGPVCP